MIKISKALDKDYLSEQLTGYTRKELYEIVTEKVIVTPESYTRCASTDPGAILVDSTNILVISLFIEDITIGEYVYHTDEVSYDQQVRRTKYQPRTADNMSDSEIDDMFNESSEEVEKYKKLIDDTSTSTTKVWSSQHTSDKIDEGVTTAETYADGLVNDDKISSIATHSSYKINEDITKVLQDAKDYADNLLGQSKAAKYELVTTLPTTDIDTSTLYILDDGTSYPIYVYDSKNAKWIKTGADLSSIDLSAYEKKADLVTTLADYAKTTDVVLIADLAQDLTTPSTTTVASTKAVSDEINKIVSGGIDLSGYVKTSAIVADMTTTSSSTILSTDGLKTELADKVDKDQGTANAGKALIVGTDGNVTVGDAGVKVSPKSNNAIEEITTTGEEGIYVDSTAYVKADQGTTNADKALVVGTDGKVTLSSSAVQPATVVSTTEPTDQVAGATWLEEY